VRLDDARSKVASILGAKPSEIVFTAVEANRQPRDHGSLQIAGTGQTLRYGCLRASSDNRAYRVATRCGFKCDFAEVDRQGRLDPAHFAAALRPDTQLASVMLANNEVGTVYPIAELAQVAREHKSVFHTDAVQAFGKIPVNVNELGVDMLSLSSHNSWAEGIGVSMFVPAHGSRLSCSVRGRQGRRPGTENVPGAVGTALAMQIAVEETAGIASCRQTRRRIRKLLTQQVEDIEFFGDRESRLPNTVAVGSAALMESL